MNFISSCIPKLLFYYLSPNPKEITIQSYRGEHNKMSNLDMCHSYLTVSDRECFLCLNNNKLFIFQYVVDYVFKIVLANLKYIYGWKTIKISVNVEILILEMLFENA